MDNLLRIVGFVLIIAHVTSFPFHRIDKRHANREFKRNIHSSINDEYMRTLITDMFNQYNIPPSGYITDSEIANYYHNSVGVSKELAIKLSQWSLMAVHGTRNGVLNRQELLTAMRRLNISDYL